MYKFAIIACLLVVDSAWGGDRIDEFWADCRTKLRHGADVTKKVVQRASKNGRTELPDPDLIFKGEYLFWKPEYRVPFLAPRGMVLLMSDRQGLPRGYRDLITKLLTLNYVVGYHPRVEKAFQKSVVTNLGWYSRGLDSRAIDSRRVGKLPLIIIADGKRAFELAKDLAEQKILDGSAVDKIIITMPLLSRFVPGIKYYGDRVVGVDRMDQAIEEILLTEKKPQP